MKYIKSLDGFRGFALLLVVIFHYFPRTHWVNFLPIGPLGVDAFFVLSGFLITAILLNYKTGVEDQQATLGVSLAVFYWRRTLRIFPLYYVFIAVLLLAGYKSVLLNWPYYITYTANILYFNQQSFAGTVSPVWSLAVEEQFYLIWPLVILLCSQRWLLRVILFFLAIGVFTKLFFASVPFIACFPTYSYDAFGLGALVALMYKKNKLNNVRNFLIGGVLLVAFGAIVASTAYGTQVITPLVIGQPVFAACILFFLVKYSFTAVWWNQIFEHKVLVYLGKISYAMYLFHSMVPSPVGKLVQHFPIMFSLYTNLYVAFLINFLVSMALASASWYFFEKPILAYKNSWQILRVARV